METERLSIDHLSESDREDCFLNVSHDKKVLETFMCPYEETLEDFDFEAILSRYRDSDRLMAIRLKSSSRLIGLLVYFEETETSCEIGYCLGSGFRGKGYATEAVGKYMEYLFGKKGFKKIFASFFTGNDASRRVMEKCGMTFCRFAPKELSYLGVERDLTYYCVEKERFIAGRS